MLAREVGLSDWVKVEVIGDAATLYPDVQATVQATAVLVKEGFTVLPYTTDDIVFAKRLIDAGAAAVMPLGAPIGTGLGIANTYTLRMMRELITDVPLVVDAGLGTASDAALAMEMGFDAVLLNTAMAGAKDPVLMSSAMKKGVEAGREAFLAGRMPKKLYATASSPIAAKASVRSTRIGVPGTLRRAGSASCRPASSKANAARRSGSMSQMCSTPIAR